MGVTANKFYNTSFARGQGTLELVLILVVLAGLLLAFNQRVFKPFGEYTKSYMSDYLGCLLDKGVLPKLKSEDDSCSDALKVSSGNPFNPKNAKGSTAGKDSQGQKQPSEIAEASSSRAGGARSSGADSAARERFNTRKSSDGANPENKTISVPNPLAESKFYKTSRYGSAGSSGGNVVRVYGLSGLLAAERDRLKKREERISKVATVESEESLGKAKKMRIENKKRTPTEVQDDEPLGFGGWLRMIIIIVIIIAILVFLGGQANQISKSWEK